MVLGPVKAGPNLIYRRDSIVAAYQRETRSIRRPTEGHGNKGADHVGKIDGNPAGATQDYEPESSAIPERERELLTIA